VLRLALGNPGNNLNMKFLREKCRSNSNPEISVTLASERLPDFFKVFW
jgi:hypothetical protein